MILPELLPNATHKTVRIITQHRAQAALCSESRLTGSQAGTCNCFPLSFLQLCLWGLCVDTVLHGLLRPLHGRAFVIHLELAGVLLMLQRQKQQWSPLPHQQITQNSTAAVFFNKKHAHLSRSYRTGEISHLEAVKWQFYYTGRSLWLSSAK